MIFCILNPAAGPSGAFFLIFFFVFGHVKVELPKPIECGVK